VQFDRTKKGVGLRRSNGAYLGGISGQVMLLCSEVHFAAFLLPSNRSQGKIGQAQEFLKPRLLRALAGACENPS
jgi:hypothetical protein